MAPRSAEGRRHVALFALMGDLKKIERAGMQDQRGRGGQQDYQRRVEQLPAAGLMRPQPPDKQQEEDGVGDKMQQPQAPGGDGEKQSIFQGFPAGHHFTSMVAASVVASTDG